MLQRLKEFTMWIYSTLSKKEVLKKHPDLQKLFYYTYNNQIQFNVTSSNLKKKMVLIELGYSDLFDLLDDL